MNWCKFCGDPVYDYGENVCPTCYHLKYAHRVIYAKPGISWRGWRYYLPIGVCLCVILIVVLEWAK